MIESRCGIICSECSYRDQLNCQGCTHIEKPFWGESCPVKDCCEDKMLDHCGGCNEFPCALLNEFSYDKEQSDNGKCIEQRKKWVPR